MKGNNIVDGVTLSAYNQNRFYNRETKSAAFCAIQ